MEGRRVQLMECMVLEQFFPLNGVDGVEEQSIYGDDVDQYRTAIGASFDDELIFKKVMKTRGKAMTWFIPGDVICRRIGLEEDRCDVLRPMRDRVFVSEKVDASSFKKEVEQLRREAIEGHKWKVRRDKTWFAIIDPQGRSLVMARRHWSNTFTTLMEQLCPMLEIHKVYACKPYRVASSWCAFKTMHRYAMEHCDVDMSASQMLKCMRYAETIYMRRVALKKSLGTGRIVKMYKYRNRNNQAFWDRCFKMMDDGVPVPYSVRHVRDHFCTRWVAVSPEEMDWYLSCMYWPEWILGGPVRFCKFVKGKRGRMWK
jgi:hypothetical protein